MVERPALKMVTLPTAPLSAALNWSTVMRAGGAAVIEMGEAAATRGGKREDKERGVGVMEEEEHSTR